MKTLQVASAVLLSSFMFTIPKAQAQEDKGIRFEHGLSWSELKAKAKTENRYIFLDAFTTWCGPCKMMAKDVFPLPEVGAFYNTNFINVKMQVDRTKNDSEEVKKWYSEADSLAKAFKVVAYPTYLFFSPQGELVHRVVGGGPADLFIKKGKAALDPEKQYYTLKKRYEAGDKKSELLLELANQSVDGYDKEFSRIVVPEYLATQQNLYTNKNLHLIKNTTRKSTDPGFKLFKENQAQVDSVLGIGASSKLLMSVARQEIINPFIFNQTKAGAEPDWKLLSEKLKGEYASLTDELLLNTKAMYYAKAKNFVKFNEVYSEYFAKYADKISPYELNNYAWTIFQNCDDIKCIQNALKWSEKSLTGQNSKEVMFMDTYANLLYKAGKKADAIKIQTEALELSEGKNEAVIRALDKMKKDEKTW